MPQITPRQALTNWSRFYERVLPYREQVVVAGFHDVTTDYCAVLREVNERYGTSFACFEHTDANVRSVFDLMESATDSDTGRCERHCAPAFEGQQDSMGRGTREVESASTARIRRRAREAYAELMQTSLEERKSVDR
ncbi:MAG: hypothetical protein ABWZ53_05820 [Actinomycetota bacterium]